MKTNDIDRTGSELPRPRAKRRALWAAALLAATTAPLIASAGVASAAGPLLPLCGTRPTPAGRLVVPAHTFPAPVFCQPVK